MSRIGAITTASGSAGRRKVESIVICIVLLTSTASATLGLALLAAVNAPFQHAFAVHQGSDVTLTVDTAHVSASRLDATRTLPGVIAASGPYPEASVQITFGGLTLGPRIPAARPSTGGPVDELTLSSGHWPTGPGQVVLYSGDQGPGELGDSATVTGVPGVSSLTVVGFAGSVTGTADGWVSPDEVSLLRAPGTDPAAQLLYRFAASATDAEIATDIAQLKRALPAVTVTGAVAWQDWERKAAGNASIIQPFIVAFALLCLALSVLIVGNVVSASVVAQYHRIGVLKSIGFAPADVAVSYLLRVGTPAFAGCAAGVVVGNLAATPVLDHSSGIYGVGRPQAPLWVSVVAVAGMLVLTALAAFGPAVRAGRLSAVRPGHRGRSRATRRPRLPRTPALLTPAAAPAGRHRVGRAVRPAVSQHRDGGGDRVRCHGPDVRRGPHHGARPGTAGSDALRHRSRATPTG